MKMYYVSPCKWEVLPSTEGSYYIHEFRNTKAHLLQVYLGARVDIEIVIELHACSIERYCYNSFLALSWYISIIAN